MIQQTLWQRRPRSRLGGFEFGVTCWWGEPLCTLKSEKAYTSVLFLWVVWVSLQLSYLGLVAGRRWSECYEQPHRHGLVRAKADRLNWACWGQQWPVPPPPIDYGAYFAKDMDAPVLCRMAQGEPLLEERLRCEFVE
jgi:hypothetical protein